MKTLEQIEKELFALKKQLVELETLKQKLTELPEKQRLAIYLHDKLCPHNHTDGCDWYYDCDKHGMPNFKHNTQQEWLRKATLLLNKTTYDIVIDIVEIIKS